MEFESKGRSYDTKDMEAFLTGQPTIPTIYISKNHESFLEAVRACWPAPRIRAIDHCEARRLADAYGLRELQKALMQTSRNQSEGCLRCNGELLSVAAMQSYSLGHPTRAMLFVSNADSRCFIANDANALSQMDVTEISTEEAIKLAETFGTPDALSVLCPE